MRGLGTAGRAVRPERFRLSGIARRPVFRLLIAVPRVAPRAAVTVAREPLTGLGWPSVGHDGQGPATAAEFAGDRDVRDGGSLLPCDELLPFVMQAVVAGVTAGDGGTRGGRPPGLHHRAGPVGLAVMPCGFDEQSAGVRVPRLGDRSLRACLPRRRLRWHQAEERTDRRAGESVPLADPTANANPVNVDTPRRQPSRCTIGAYSLLTAMSWMSMSSRSLRALTCCTAS
jgi:hypothetical protein